MNTEQKEYWSSLVEKCKTFENSLNADYRKKTGSYFTGFEMADVMVSDLIDAFRKKYGKVVLVGKTFLEPCGGAGNFIYCYLKRISELDFTSEEINTFIDKTYYCDANPKAVDFYKKNFTEFCKVFFNIKLSKEYFKTHVGSSLLFDINDETPQYIPLQSVFPNLEKVDIIITNPPYKNFKAETKHYETKEAYEHDIAIYSKIKELASNRLKYSIDGILNFYKLFVEEIFDNYAADNTFINLFNKHIPFIRIR